MGDANNNPKPSAGPAIHFFNSKGYAIVDGSGLVISHFCHSKDRLYALLDQTKAQYDAKARRGRRACMCCQRPFDSEGIHNRLCSTCRHRDAAGVLGSARIPRRSGRLN